MQPRTNQRQHRSNPNTTSVEEYFKLSVALYSDDLPNPLILDEELHHWKLRWLEVSQQGRPETLSDALKQCSLLKTYTLSS